MSGPTNSTDALGPHEAVALLLERLTPVGVETLPWRGAVGRVLAEPLVTDRPSPPADVSAMDGYAVRLSDLARGELPIGARCLPGRAAPAMTDGQCVQIMTGAVVPEGAEAVIKREDVAEHDDRIVVPSELRVEAGANIRRRGENEAAGAVVVERGRAIDAATTAALTSFGMAEVRVHQAVRIAIVVTGDELLGTDETAADYQIRDSNGPTLQALWSAAPWARVVDRRRVADDESALRKAVSETLAECDALLMTGGVSAGTHDFVPGVLADAGCDVAFHKLPIRPGRPVLGAVGPDGQLVMGLPGNPVSVMCTARRLAAPLLRKRAGLADPIERVPRVELTEHDGRPLHLWWYRPVTLDADGRATFVAGKGSGDIVSAARSDGFVEISPGRTDAGPWPYYAWSVR